VPTFDALSLVYTVGIVLVVIVAVRFVERQISGHYSVNVSSCEEQIAALLLLLSSWKVITMYHLTHYDHWLKSRVASTLRRGLVYLLS